MDMTAATSQSGADIPVGPYELKNAKPAFNTKTDGDPAPRIHGLVMSFVFIIVLPIGALLLRVWRKVMGHIVVQTIGVVLFCMAFAGGCVVSLQFNRSKNFNSAHQVIGILLLLAMLSQYALGVVHHRIFKKEQRKTVFGKVHRFLGPSIIFIAIINGGLGFQLGGKSTLHPLLVPLPKLALTSLLLQAHPSSHSPTQSSSSSSSFSIPVSPAPPTSTDGGATPRKRLDPRATHILLSAGPHPGLDPVLMVHRRRRIRHLIHSRMCL